LDRAPEIEADTLYVIGGLYGNVESLAAIAALASREPGPVTLAFNGDFHWFDVSDGDFAQVTREVLRHPALRGNVETEIAGEDSGAGCGCAYPIDVSDAEVARSNEICLRCAPTGAPRARLRARLGRVADAPGGASGRRAASASCMAMRPRSPAGALRHDQLDKPAHRRWVEVAFADAKVDIFASTHTCLPAFRRFDGGVVANNGAAGMPNFADSRYGLVTRIALARSPDRSASTASRPRGAQVEACASTTTRHAGSSASSRRGPRVLPRTLRTSAASRRARASRSPRRLRGLHRPEVAARRAQAHQPRPAGRRLPWRLRLGRARPLPRRRADRNRGSRARARDR
jgi:hypothetical protein